MKKFVAIFLAIIMVISIAGCSGQKQPTDSTDDREGNNQSIEPSTEDIEKEATLYFANRKYVETGDESQEKLIAEKRMIRYDDISIEEAIVKELMKGTENPELVTEIPGTAELIDVKTTEGIAYVNFAREGMYGGSLQEGFTIDQIVTSLLELDNVEAVQFLIDSEKEESLMGHIVISEPFKK